MSLEARDTTDRKATYVGLSLTKEQAELLQKYIDEGQAFIKAVNESDDKLASGFDAVNDLLWGQRAQDIMKQAGKPDIDAIQPDTTTPDNNAGADNSTETNQPDATQPAA
jgi:hypothetical protein